MPQQDNIYDIIIIGAGPAGLTAGIYACRSGLRALLLERMFPGGQIATTAVMENYPGFPEGVSGPDFSDRLYRQAERSGLEMRFDDVQALDLSAQPKRITAGGQTHLAWAVILAMGAQPRTLGLPNEDALRGGGVSYCATCDGSFYKDKPVAVVGGGDTACEDAMYLARLTEPVYLIHRRDTLRAQGTLVERVTANPRIRILWNSVVSAAEAQNDTLHALQVRDLQSGQTQRLPVQGMFVAVGAQPVTELVRGQLPLDESGYIRTDERMRTALPGVFAAGDIRAKALRQVITAAADGAIAAQAALECLEE